jgi:hypothetical protein
MKKVIKKSVNLFLLGMVYLLTIATKRLAIKNTWLPKHVHVELKVRVMENTYGNQQLAKYINASGLYSYMIILVDVFRIRGKKRGRPGYYLLSTLPTTGQVITARLALGKTDSEQVARSRFIKTHCTGNTSVPFTGLEISALGTAINTFEDSHGAAREVAYTNLNNMLKTVFLTRIQTAADLVGILAIVLIQSCGCIVQGVGGSHEQIFDCFYGVATGTVMLIAPAAGKPNSCNDWWVSLDNITWVRMPPTVNANTMAIGLPVGELAYFRHETVLTTGGTGISQTISIMVK